MKNSSLLGLQFSVRLYLLCLSILNGNQNLIKKKRKKILTRNFSNTSEKENLIINRMGLVLEGEKINSIFFVFMNNTLFKGDAWHTFLLKFCRQKIKDFRSKMKEQLEKDEDQTQALILSLSIQFLFIKFYPLFACCMLSTLRLWALTLAASAAHFPCSRQTKSGKNIPCVQ